LDEVFKEVQMSPEAEDLIRRFLCDRKDRIGSRGVEEIKAHPFFKGIDWEGIRNQRAPIIPQIQYPTDTSNFCVENPDKFSDESEDEEEEEAEEEHRSSPSKQTTKNQRKANNTTNNTTDFDQIEDDKKREKERRKLDKKYPLYR
jgi:hypothetical protein